jgi:hypothetical protein
LQLVRVLHAKDRAIVGNANEQQADSIGRDGVGKGNDSPA